LWAWYFCEYSEEGTSVIEYVRDATGEETGDDNVAEVRYYVRDLHDFGPRHFERFWVEDPAVSGKAKADAVIVSITLSWAVNFIEGTWRLTEEAVVSGTVERTHVRLAVGVFLVGEAVFIGRLWDFLHYDERPVFVLLVREEDALVVTMGMPRGFCVTLFGDYFAAMASVGVEPRFYERGWVGDTDLFTVFGLSPADCEESCNDGAGESLFWAGRRGEALDVF